MTANNDNKELEKLIDEDYRYLSGDVYTRRADYNTAGGVFTVTVPEGHWFVLGDNRNESADSRSTLIGLVDERRVLGRVILRVAPLARFGTVN